MKKLIIMLLIIASGSSYAQITLENTYPNSGLALHLVKLSSSGYKYVISDTSTITLFNLNHTVFRSINIPPGGYTSVFNICYISEELFNTNPTDIEYFLLYSHSSPGFAKVFDEAGNLLFFQDSVVMYGSPLGRCYEDFISYTSSGYKMMIAHGLGTVASVYSLPGFLPCNDCTNGVITGMVPNNSNLKEGNISNYPNPAKGQTTIEYELPQGITNGDLVFYTIQGQVIKQFKVTNAFHDIIISTAELDARRRDR